MKRVYGTITVALLFAVGVAVPAEAVVITVDDFTTITGGEFVDIPQTFATGASTASVVITGDPTVVWASEKDTNAALRRPTIS